MVAMGCALLARFFSGAPPARGATPANRRRRGPSRLRKKRGFRTGRPIEAPSLDALAGWDVDLEDEDGAIEEEP